MTKRIIIITGMGRSGSMFLGTLLKQADRVQAAHEYFNERHFVSLSYHRPDHPYLDVTLGRMRQQLPLCDTFIDVNPGLRYAVDAVQRVLEPSHLFHLVRDGRKVVTSTYVRKVYTSRERSLPVMPTDPQEFARWVDWPRFEQVCWYWRDAVDKLLAREVPLLHLEKLTSDYDYFKSHLLDPAELSLSQQVWDQMRQQRVNRTRFQLKRLLPWRESQLAWSDQLEDRFWAVCGQTMQALGYQRQP